MAYRTLRFGVDVTAGDIDGDGRSEMVTAPGPGEMFGPHLRGFELENGPAAPIPGVSFSAFSTQGFGARAAAGDVDLGGTAVQISAGTQHSCALLEGGSVRCWGGGDFDTYGCAGCLGYGNRETIGDDEAPSSVGDVDVGGRVLQIAAGGDFTCALLEGGRVRCWGDGQRGHLR